MPMHPYRLRTLAPVIISFIALITLSGVWLLSVGKGESFRMIAGFHSPITDFIFKYITHLGDGIFILSIAVLFAFFKKYPLSIAIVGSYIFSGIFAQSGKYLYSSPRPKAYFEAIGQQVREIEGVTVHLSNSFPSGHTTSAFALAMVLVLFSRPSVGSAIIFLLLACAVGYSRVYLSQHFPVDVWSGALIGSISGLVVYAFIQRKMTR